MDTSAYRKVGKTKILPEPISSSSSALPIKVPGMCIFLLPIVITSDVIATEGNSLATSRYEGGPFVAST
jgi:hypothetical protein